MEIDPCHDGWSSKSFIGPETSLALLYIVIFYRHIDNWAVDTHTKSYGSIDLFDG